MIRPLAEVEREAILEAVEVFTSIGCKKAKIEAARILGISKSKIYRKLAEYRKEGQK